MKTIVVILALVLLSAVYTVYSIGRVGIVTPVYLFLDHPDAYSR